MDYPCKHIFRAVDSTRSQCAKCGLISVPDRSANRIAELEAENKRLREALEDVEGFLRNDRYKTRVRNALAIIEMALGK